MLYSTLTRVSTDFDGSHVFRKMSVAFMRACITLGMISRWQNMLVILPLLIAMVVVVLIIVLKTNLNRLSPHLKIRSINVSIIVFIIISYLCMLLASRTNPTPTQNLCGQTFSITMSIRRNFILKFKATADSRT